MNLVDSEDYLVYILTCETNNKTYVGMTNNFFHRWRQHNGEIKGGAKYTTRFGNEWYPILIIDGFKTMKEAMQCEWKVKRKKGIHKRVKGVYDLLIGGGTWTSKSPLIHEQHLTIYVDPEYKMWFEEYEAKELWWK